MTVIRVDPVDSAAVATALLADSAPPNLTVMAPQTGTQQKAARGDHTHPVRVQRGRFQTISDGTITWTYPTPFNMTPAIAYTVETDSSATQPMVVNIIENDQFHVKVKVFQARTLPAVLTLLTNLISYSVFNSAPQNMTVNLFAAEPTQ